MREHHHLQTPLKEHGNRRSKSISDQTKKPLKNVKKSLNSAFESQGAALSELSPKESIGSSPISSATTDDINLLTESAAEDFLLIPETSPSSEAVDPLAELTSLSSTLTSEKYKEYTGSNSSSGVSQSSDVKIGFVEAEMAVKYLREAQMQLVNATDVDVRYKKLLDAVVNTLVEEFYGLPEDKDWYNTLISKKFHVVTLAFLLWIIAIFIGLLFRSGGKQSFYGPLPS
ncbi:uncharacterized protein LOC107760296 [Nicotiana tabacum]|uniref:Uncharacterized protein LOC107760296 n=1 Tax=Nicotiana tabacum TaxID=4097 RepID=A0A1S3X1W1_TOBAC|nr:PREDICTED: uncharacterized protein LOC107760296 [Nicotiana tabacum]